MATEKELRHKVVNIMKGWLGWSEVNGKFKAIIDLYNTQKPLPVGYKMKYTDGAVRHYLGRVFLLSHDRAVQG